MEKEKLLDVADGINFLPPTDGVMPTKWEGGLSLLAYKICQGCGCMIIKPNRSRKNLAKTRFCSQSCWAKHENVMRSSVVREKVSQTLKKIGHKPRIRGGNGQLTEIQKNFLKALGKGWETEVAIPTKCPRSAHLYPTCYKVDLGNKQLKLAIELDGYSHSAIIKKAQDKKKDQFLQSVGWKVLRLKNQEAESRYMTWLSKGIPVISLKEF